MEAEEKLKEADKEKDIFEPFPSTSQSTPTVPAPVQVASTRETVNVEVHQPPSRYALPIVRPFLTNVSDNVNVPPTPQSHQNLDEIIVESVEYENPQNPQNEGTERPSETEIETFEKYALAKTLTHIMDKLDKPSADTLSGRKEGLIFPDTTKLEYFSTPKKNYQMWLSLFMTELSLKRLEDMIDENVPPYRPFSQAEIDSRKNIVRGIILSHVDEHYQENIIEISEPRDMLVKLQKMKRDEINDTTVSLREQLRNLTFKIGTETLNDFNLSFDEVVRKFDVISPIKMSENDKRDAYYQIISKIIPSIKDATYRDVAKGVGDGFTLIELRKYAQQYEAENRASFQPKHKAMLLTLPPDQRATCCFNCDAMGHIARDCPRPRNHRLCYNCGQFGHKAFECNNPKNKSVNTNLPSKPYGYNNPQTRPYRRGTRGRRPMRGRLARHRGVRRFPGNYGRGGRLQ